MTQTEEDVNENIGRLHDALSRHGLVINWNKSNTIVFSKDYIRWNMECKVEVEGVRLEQVRETIYFGVRLSDNGEMESELQQKIGMAATAAGALHERASLWKQGVK